MASVCYSPLKGKIIRVVRLDECGAVVTGADNMIVSDGFVSVQFAPQYEDGQEFIVKNANGDFCVNEKDADRLKRINLTINLCSVDTGVFDIILGADPITDGGDTVGGLFGEGANTTKFGFELWSGVAGGACGDEGNAQYEHLALGWVENARLNDTTYEYGPAQITITASTHKAPDYGTGPFGILPTPFGALDHMARYLTPVAPPEAACGLQALAA